MQSDSTAAKENSVDLLAARPLIVMASREEDDGLPKARQLAILGDQGITTTQELVEAGRTF